MSPFKHLIEIGLIPLKKRKVSFDRKEMLQIRSSRDKRAAERCTDLVPPWVLTLRLLQAALSLNMEVGCMSSCKRILFYFLSFLVKNLTFSN